MKESYIYLATPYTHSDREIMEYRNHLAGQIAGKLMEEGHIVFSPISHSHQIAADYGLPTSWEYWERSCEVFVSLASKLVVITTDGWDKSVGVTGEINIAKRLGIPIEYHNPY